MTYKTVRTVSTFSKRTEGPRRWAKAPRVGEQNFGEAEYWNSAPAPRGAIPNLDHSRQWSNGDDPLKNDLGVSSCVRADQLRVQWLFLQIFCRWKSSKIGKKMVKL